MDEEHAETLQNFEQWGKNMVTEDGLRPLTVPPRGSETGGGDGSASPLGAQVANGGYHANGEEGAAADAEDENDLLEAYGQEMASETAETYTTCGAFVGNMAICVSFWSFLVFFDSFPLWVKFCVLSESLFRVVPFGV